ncbi:ComEA family DNA-binding protein [Amphibiibacter pelophylacis]|uniref:Helix-hairpin-helix domain-containing protein n=1 Tax=Amphibiibacter pelophylacis TaxID=1799477 RepID=A0ACC6P3E6_9BURK
MTTPRFSSAAASVRKILSRSLIGLLMLPLAGTALALDINQASPSELDAIDGIGPKMVQRLVTARQQAPFKDWADVRTRVSGIGDKTQKRFESQGLTIGAGGTRVAAASPAAAAAKGAAVLPGAKPAAKP